MSRITFDKQHNIETPSLLLQNRNFDTIGRIANASGLTYREHFNSADELSFTVHKNENDSHSLWDSLVDFKIIYIPELEERFEITVSTSSQQTDCKHITGTSLCEAELSQVKLYDLEINTETDILNSSYLEDFPTVFYRNPEMFVNYEWKKDYTLEEKKQILRSSSLLHRILEKAEHYSIAHVDESLMREQRSFGISNTDVYSELTGEIAEEFGCLFLFDSIHRTISAYDLSHVCNDCGYRGDFTDCCPKCGSQNIKEPYGQDTTIFISTENLASEISLDTNRDALKNCFYVEGGDETMNAAVRSLNPNGSSYFYCFSKEAKEDMPKELVQALDSYDDLYASYLSEREFPLKTTAVTGYNQVLAEIKHLFADENLTFQPLPNKLAGYPAVTSAIYDVIDFYEFLENSMMPTIHIDGLGLEESLQSIVQGFANGFSKLQANGTAAASFPNKIALRNPTTAAQFTVENAIKKSAGLYYGKAYYELEVNTLSYTQATNSAPNSGSWRGTFTLTSRTEKQPDTDIFLSKTSAPVTLSITSDAELFIQQSIYRKTADTEEGKYGDVTSLQMDFETFKKRIELYSRMELHALRDAFQACLSVIDAAEISEKSLQKRYHNFYFQRFWHIDTKMLPKRERQLETVAAMYHMDSATLETSGILHNIRQEINQALDFKKYVQNCAQDSETDLWKTFCACRREDKYTNSNYISDGMTNAQVLTHAKELVETAQKELYKAAHLQYTLSASMNDLLALKEFQPLADAFSCGNWMNLGVDGKVYKLRLLSYQVSFDDISAIDVEFSTVEKLQSGVSDVKSILQSAASMSQSYSGVMHQMSHSKQTSNQVQDWLTKGLNATQLKFVNSDAQDIVIDEHGILARQYDNITNSYGDCQLKILGNGIYTTQDGWQSIQTGLGHISYHDPETDKIVEDYGLIAKAVVGKLFLGESLKIYNESGSMKFTGDGFSISNLNSGESKNTFTVNPNDSNRMLRIMRGTKDVFYTDNAGNLHMIGTLDINGGFFRGNIEALGTIKGGRIVGAGIEGGTISIGNGNFLVDKNGLSTITGNITATSGKIGPFLINDSGIKSPSGSVIIQPSKIQLINNSNSTPPFLEYKNNSTSLGYINENGMCCCGQKDIGYGINWNGSAVLKNILISEKIESRGKLQILGTTTFSNKITGIENSKTTYSIDSNGSAIFQSLHAKEDIQVDKNFLANGDILARKNIETKGNILGSSNQRIGAQDNPWGHIYTNLLTLKPNTYNILGRINALWIDSDNHDALTVNEDGLTTSVGWDGISERDNTIYKSNLKLRSQTVTLAYASGITTSSDERLKHSLEDLDPYDEVYMDLQPLSYKYKNGASGRKHFGFGAGQVRDSLEKHGFTTQDFAGFIQMEQQEDDASKITDPMGLIYTEFIAWNTHMIQKLYKENQELKQRIEKLEGDYNHVLHRL